MPDTALNEEKVARYLESHLSGFKGPLTATKFAGGQSNPTYKIDAQSGTYVLRRQPPGKLLKSAHAVDREYRVLHALKNTPVPVANVYHLCTDTGIIGSMFYVMEFIEGRVFWDAALPEIGDRETRGTLYDEMNRVLAAIHSIDPNAVGLADYGKPGNYFERQLNRWTQQYRASEMGKIEAMETLMSWLQRQLPAEDGLVSLVHGDFRLDNLIFHPTEPRILAVIDWELSTLGHPYADLAYQCMQMRLPGSAGHAKGLLGKDRASLGIPSETEYVAKYCARRGLQGIANWTFYLAFSFFRLAAIAQGVAKRARDGNASSKEAERVGAMVEPLAHLALQTISENGDH